MEVLVTFLWQSKLHSCVTESDRNGHTGIGDYNENVRNVSHQSDPRSLPLNFRVFKTISKIFRMKDVLTMQLSQSQTIFNFLYLMVNTIR